MSTNSTIPPGAVNEERTKCCCQCCEQELDFDPSWGHEQECPLCHETLFAWSCDTCYFSYLSHSQTEEPPFPDFPCNGCDKSLLEMEQEEAQAKALKEEQARIERGAFYRRLEQEHRHQNNINHTLTSLTTGNSQDAFHPKNLADALRISPETWENIWPLLQNELAQQGLDESVLTPSWGQRVLTFFERSWLEDNSEGLRCGVVQNLTGHLYMFECLLSCNLRSLRESFDECLAIFPTLTKVTIDESTWQVSWEPDPPEDSDPRDVYKSDGTNTLTMYEFLLWCIRLGYGLKRFNPKHYIDDDNARNLITEPVAYVPTDWVGRPQKWFDVRDDGFRRFHWMDPPVRDWNGRVVPESQLRDISRRNMQHCCVCYGSPPAGKELLICECRECLYCSQQCKDEYMLIHKYTTSTDKHCTLDKLCSSCGERQPNLKRCTKCKHAYFCNKECQRRAWEGHKQHCVP